MSYTIDFSIDLVLQREYLNSKVIVREMDYKLQSVNCSKFIKHYGFKCFGSMEPLSKNNREHVLFHCQNSFKYQTYTHTQTQMNVHMIMKHFIIVLVCVYYNYFDNSWRTSCLLCFKNGSIERKHVNTSCFINVLYKKQFRG